MSDCGGDPNCTHCAPKPAADQCGDACYDSEAKARYGRGNEPAKRTRRVRHTPRNVAGHRKARRKMAKASRRGNR